MQGSKFTLEGGWIRQVLAQIPAGVAIAEAPSGAIVFRNPAMVALQGGVPDPSGPGEYTRLGAEHLDGRAYEAHEYPIARVLATGQPVTEELVWRRPDGSGTRCVASAAPLKDAEGKLLGAVAIVHDVTERRREEASLRESAQRALEAREEAERRAATLDALFAACPIGMALLDRELRYVRVNSALAAFHGVEPAQVEGRRLEEVVTRDSLPSVEGSLRRALESGLTHSLEFRGTARGTAAEIRDWHAFHCGIRLPGGPVVGVGSFAQDVTPEKRTEDALQQLLRKEHDLRSEAERATRLRDELLAGISHDLKTPLSSILVGASVLGNEGRTTEDMARTADLIRASARQMNRMIGDLLDIIRAARGRLTVDLAPVSGADLLHEAQDAHRVAVEARSFRLEVERPDAALDVTCDRQRVLQVVGTLIGNAIKGARGGGSVTLACSGTDTEVIFSVTAQGPGMSPEVLPDGSEPLPQAGGSGGLGLELTLAKALVEHQNGRIWLESRSDARTFRFALPRVHRA
jgi:two-component system CheB/CheR fusion protein